MSFESLRVISATPAGRRAHLDILVRFLLRNRPLIDEHHFWVNTKVEDDIACIRDLCERHPDFFRAIPATIPVEGNLSIHHFFEKGYCDDDTVYIRLDDDICFIADDALPNLVRFRITHPEYFLVFGNVVNNALIDHIRQRNGLVPKETMLIDYEWMGNGWSNLAHAEILHDRFIRDILNGRQDAHKKIFERWELWQNERVSINCFSWLGSEFAKFAGRVEQDDEHFLSCEATLQSGKINVILGNALFAHYAFHFQRAHLDTTDILTRYNGLSLRHAAASLPGSHGAALKRPIP